MKGLVAGAGCAIAIAFAAGAGLWVHGASAADTGGGATGSRVDAPAVARVWHGKTPRAKADEYERYLAAAIQKFPTIKGNRGYQLMRLDGGPDGEQYTEFQVISYWDSPESIKAYAGQDIRRTHDLPRDGEFLVDKEPFVHNYELRVNALRR